MHKDTYLGCDLTQSFVVYPLYGTLPLVGLKGTCFIVFHRANKSTEMYSISFSIDPRVPPHDRIVPDIPDPYLCH